MKQYSSFKVSVFEEFVDQIVIECTKGRVILTESEAGLAVDIFQADKHLTTFELPNEETVEV